MLDTHTNTDTARLVLAVGSRAGREAPLQHGYYMIGRHRECQIRPKSRSVSRRHCLLFQDGAGLQVLDLNSTSGTRVNDLRIRPKTWTTLRNGDMLRCGKVVFRVDLGQPVSGSAPSSRSSVSEGAQAESMPVGEAWHDVDIAGFLETQDDADRERRYDHIRSVSENDSDASDVVSDELEHTIEMDVDLDLFHDAFNDPLPAETSVTSDPDQQPRTAASDPAQRSDGPAAAAGSKVSRKVNKPSRPSRLAATKSTRRFSSRSFSFGISGGADRWKMVGLTLLTLAALGAVGYSALSFYSGPSVRVLQSID